jgi:signal transduction histidine kinase/DNA-binding response OmpR family regulator
VIFYLEIGLGIIAAGAIIITILRISGEKTRADERMQIMLNSAPIGVTFWDKDAKNIDCNQEVVRLFDLTGKKEYSRRFLELSPEYQPDGSPSGKKAFDFVQKAFEDGFCHFEWMHQKFNGEPIPCDITLVRVKYKKDFIVVGYTRDLREIRKTIQQMNESKESLTIFTNVLNGIDAEIYVCVPHTGEILFANDFMKKKFNIMDDCAGKKCYKIFLDKNQEKICDFCPCYQLDKDPHNTVVWEMRLPTGQTMRNSTRYIEWIDGRTVQIQLSVDISEVITAKEQAEQSSRYKSQFLSHMSHEIRTPMNAILGITEIQLQNESHTPDMQEALGKIYNSGYLLLGIINDILDLSKIEAGKLELTPVNYDVPSLINDTVYLNIMRFDAKPITFDLRIEENIPLTLFGDELRIKQILNNLLSNAFKYTSAGNITLSVCVEDIPGDKENKELVFSVSDTGSGITSDQMEKLFDEYTRFDLKSNRATEGSGLGMNITKRLVDLMNGKITVESEHGKGSVFTVRLPQGIVDAGVLGKAMIENLMQFRLGDMSQLRKAPQIIREPMPYGKVLVVDDVGTNLYVAKGLMTPYGLSVETVESGFEAIEKIENGASYDVIFMDHFMPDMDGIETAKKLRKMGYNLPIIALTANALAGQAEMFLLNGFDGFISKPIDIHQLNAVLNKMVRDKHQGGGEKAEAGRSNAVKEHTDAADGMKNFIKGTVPLIDPQLAELFIRDAEKAEASLKAIHANNYRRADDVQKYIINAHAMKSALINIGEKELSDSALRLEEAGKGQNIAILSKDTPVFLKALRMVIEKVKPAQSAKEPFSKYGNYI